MTYKNLKEALAEVRDLIVKESKENLIAAKKGGGALENSIKGTPVSESGSSLMFQILMEDYATFVDKGVQGNDPEAQPKGALSRYNKAPNSPYQFGTGSYKGSGTLRGAIDKWVLQKGIPNVRDEKGRFIKRKTLVYLMTRSIWNTGIKPSLFYTEPYHKYLKNISKRLEKSYRVDVRDFTDFTIKQTQK
jgi:hypothetical protein